MQLWAVACTLPWLLNHAVSVLLQKWRRALIRNLEQRRVLQFDNLATNISAGQLQVCPSLLRLNPTCRDTATSGLKENALTV